ARGLRDRGAAAEDAGDGGDRDARPLRYVVDRDGHARRCKRFHTPSTIILQRDLFRNRLSQLYGKRLHESVRTFSILRLPPSGGATCALLAMFRPPLSPLPMGKVSILREFWHFLRVRKKYWL